MIRAVTVLCILFSTHAIAQDKPEAATKTMPPETPVGALTKTVDQMRNVSRALRTGAVTKELVATQSKAVADLDRLIKMAEQLPKRRRDTSSRKPKNKDTRSPDKQASKEQAETRAQQRQSQTQPSDGRRKTTGQTQQPVEDNSRASPSAAARRRILVQQIWGHLPPSLQRRLMTGESEKPLPKYERLVRRYFEVLSEKSVRVKERK